MNTADARFLDALRACLGLRPLYPWSDTRGDVHNRFYDTQLGRGLGRDTYGQLDYFLRGIEVPVSTNAP